METNMLERNIIRMLKVGCFVFLFLLFSTLYAQTSVSTVNYTSSSAIIFNPERGFYKHTEVHSYNYTPLSLSTLTGYRANNISMILRVFYMENFISSPISSSYLNSMANDFSVIRQAGLKCVVRFAYSNSTSGALDATKAQVLSHISQISSLLASNADIITAVQAGFIGAWGEWYYTDNFGLPPSASDLVNRKEVVDALLTNLPSSRMVQIRTPSLKQKTYNATSALGDNSAFNGTNLARLGHHNDCFLASASDFGTYSNASAEYPYLEQETKYLPMGGETCAVNEPRSKCPTALYEMQKFHWSYLNIDYNASVISGFQADNCFSEIQKRLGYRYELVRGVFPQAAAAGAIMPITLNIKNSGFANLYNPRIVYLVLRNTSNNQEYSVALGADPRFWAAGVENTITENVLIPSNIIAGNYKLYLSLSDPNSALKSRPEYAIRFANESVWESTTGYNNLLHTVTVQSSLGYYGDTKPEMKLYPVPTDDELIVEFPGIEEFQVTIYNSVGQKMKVNYSSISSDRINLNTQNLGVGVYYIQLLNNKQREVRCIVVNR